MKNAIDAFINESLNFKLDTMMVTGVVPSSIAYVVLVYFFPSDGCQQLES